ncbi:MAG TPA: Gldg family protein, partial [Kofleriaceae bacterium]|nr:Gldg family protein [Kofleriaceae bacterium]
MKGELHMIRTVAAKELRSFFNSAIALIFLLTFLLATLFTFFWVDKFFARNIADVRPMFEWFPLLLIFLVGALTMRMWSEEQKLGTIEVLLTLPVTVRSLVVGKFLAGMVLVALALLLTFGIPVTVEWMGDLDWGPVIGGYLGALLLAGAYLSIGLCISSVTDNQVIALIFTILACALLYLPGADAITGLFGYDTADILRQIGTGSRFSSIARGVIDLRDILYYAGIIALFLTLNAVIIDAKRWSRGKRTFRYRMNAWLAVGLCLVNVVTLDVWFSGVRSARADLTEDNEYSLSTATKHVLGQLDEPLLIRAYISRKVHPIVQPLVPQIRDLLREYGVVGGKNVRVEFVDPLGDEDLEKEAEEDYGIETLTFKFEERNESAWVNAYFSVLIKYGNQHTVLSILDMLDIERRDIDKFDVRLGNLEYEVTRAIKKTAEGFQDMERIFAAIPGHVKLTAYLTPDDLPDEFKEVPARIEKVAKELTEQSAGKFSYEVVEPKTEAQQRDLVQRYGLKPYATSPFNPQFFYMHLVLDIDGALQLVNPGEEMAEADIRKGLTEAVRRASPGYLKKIGLWKPQGFSFPNQEGGPPQEVPAPQGFEFLQENLGANHEVTEVDLSSGAVASDIDALILAGPDSLDEKAQYAVDQFLMRGGTVIVLDGRFRVTIDRRTGLKADDVKSGLEDLLKTWGIEVQPKLVLDPQSEELAVPRVHEVRGRPVQKMESLQYPFFIDVKRSGMHGPGAITTRLSDLVLEYASPVNLVDPPKDKADKEPPPVPEREVLIASSKDAW